MEAQNTNNTQGKQDAFVALKKSVRSVNMYHCQLMRHVKLLNEQKECYMDQKKRMEELQGFYSEVVEYLTTDFKIKKLNAEIDIEEIVGKKHENRLKKARDYAQKEFATKEDALCAIVDEARIRLKDEEINCQDAYILLGTYDENVVSHAAKLTRELENLKNAVLEATEVGLKVELKVPELSNIIRKRGECDYLVNPKATLKNIEMSSGVVREIEDESEDIM